MLVEYLVIIVLDVNVDNYILNYFKEIIGKKIFVIENIYKKKWLKVEISKYLIFNKNDFIKEKNVKLYRNEVIGIGVKILEEGKKVLILMII